MPAPLTHRRIATVLLAVGALLGGCSNDTTGRDASGPGDPTTTATSGATTEPADEPRGTATCDDSDPASCLLPWPNDHFTRADSTTDTGRRLDLPTDGMPANASGARIDPAEWNRSDGFAPASILLTLVPDLDMAASKLPPVTDIEQSLDDESPLALVDLDEGARVAAWAELDSNVDEGAEPLLHVVPAAALTEGHRYAVGLADLVRNDGSLVEPSDGFVAVVADDSNRPWLDALGKAGLATDRLDIGWAFTVASARSLSGRLRHMWEETRADVGEGAPPFRIDTVNDAGAARVVQGSFEMPRYLQGDGGPGTVLNNDLHPDGLPTRLGTMRSAFTCTVPTGATSDDPSEIVLYGHGLLGDRSEVLDIGQVGAAANVSFCALDFIGMSVTDIPTVVASFEDLTRFRTVPDRLQQGHLAFLLLGRLVRSAEGLASDPAFQIEGKPVIDSSKAAFLGASQGGILGGAPSALTTDWDRVVLAVGALGYQLLLPRSVDFDEFLPVFQRAYPDSTLRPLVLGLVQQLWSRGENDGYVQHLTTNPVDGATAKPTLVLEAFGDHQVPNVGTERLARTIGAALRAPSMAPGRSTDRAPQWGIEAVPSYPHRGSMLLVWDFGTPAPPVTNTPNRAGDDPHGTYGELPQALGVLARFLDTGELEDPCPGEPCRSEG